MAVQSYSMQRLDIRCSECGYLYTHLSVIVYRNSAALTRSACAVKASSVRDTFPYAARFSPAPNGRCNSRRVAPVAKSARMTRLNDAEGSPASILATRDWLEPIFLARSICDRPPLLAGCLDGVRQHELEFHQDGFFVAQLQKIPGAAGFLTAYPCGR